MRRRPPDAEPLPDHGRRARASLLAALLVLAPALLAFALRARDALSSAALPAEDPFTHLALTRAYLDFGAFPAHPPVGAMPYPQGLHALFGAILAVSGLDPVEVARYLPALTGFVAVGVAAAAATTVAGGGSRRHAWAAAFAAGVLVATTPELVLRQAALFPTMLTVVLLPALAFAGAQLARGRAAAGVALGAPLLAAFVLAHPWAAPFGLVAFAGAAAAARAGARLKAAAVVVAVGTGMVAFMLAFFRLGGYWTFTGERIMRALATPAARLASVPDALLLAAAGAAVIVALALVLVARRGGPGAARALAAALVGLVALVVVPLALANPLRLVDYRMAVGPTGGALGLAGIVLLVLRGRPAPFETAGLALVLAAFPFTVVNVFRSWFIPHRSVVLVAVGLALLGAGAAARVAAGLARASGRARLPRGARAAAAASLALALVVAATPAGAAAPLWYRYYTPEEYAQLEEIAARLDADPTLTVRVGSWQAAVILGGLAEEGYARVDLDTWFFLRGNGTAPAPDGTLVLYDRFTAHAADAQGKTVAFLGSDTYPLIAEAGPHQALYERAATEAAKSGK